MKHMNKLHCSTEGKEKIRGGGGGGEKKTQKRNEVSGKGEYGGEVGQQKK